MDYLKPFTRTDLHVHPIQSLNAEDLFELAKDCHRDIDWNRFGFLDNYEKVFGIRPDPVSIFTGAVKSGSLLQLNDLTTYRYHSKGNYEEFEIKSYFAEVVADYYFSKGGQDTLLKMIVDRRQREGLTYVEYRRGVPFRWAEKEEWKERHIAYARFFKNASIKDFQAKYIIRGVNGIWDVVKELLAENPDLVDTIVGVDFTGIDRPPSTMKRYYEEIAEDRRSDPEHSLDIVVHVGETFFDKSLESAIGGATNTPY